MMDDGVGARDVVSESCNKKTAKRTQQSGNCTNRENIHVLKKVDGFLENYLMFTVLIDLFLPWCQWCLRFRAI